MAVSYDLHRLQPFRGCGRTAVRNGHQRDYDDRVWLIFLTARYLLANRWIKGGIILIITGIWTAFSTDVYTLIVEHKRQLTILAADFTDWSSAAHINANTYLLILAVGILLGIALIAVGMTRHKK